MDPDVERFERWSATYDRWPLQMLLFNVVHRRVARSLSPTAQERVLDVGCGSGRLAVRLVRSSGCRAVGVDPAPGMVAQALRKAETARTGFCVGVAEALPFRAASFDAAVTVVSVHHWKDADRGLEEMRRVLRRGGRVVVADMGTPGRLVSWVKHLTRAERHHHGGWEARELADLLYRAGFDRVRACTERAARHRVVILQALG